MTNVVGSMISVKVQLALSQSYGEHVTSKHLWHKRLRQTLSECRENWKNSKLCENTISAQFLVFLISTRVDITVYQHGKCFIFLKLNALGNDILVSRL